MSTVSGDRTLTKVTIRDNNLPVESHVKGFTIFLDMWLERPSSLPTSLKINDVEECDYIFVSHAHFDQ